tara:strand:+ start:2023 stop:2403 length:381 start_codon:yes stop_codon:yes gene_type:complete
MNNPEYNIPEDYFAKKKIALKQIPHRENKVIKMPRWHNSLAIAASLSLLIVAGIYYFNYNRPEEANLNMVSEAALDDFISDSPYSAYPETFLLEEEAIDLSDLDSEQLFDEEQLDNYLNQYTNEFL